MKCQNVGEEHQTGRFLVASSGAWQYRSSKSNSAWLAAGLPFVSSAALAGRQRQAVATSIWAASAKMKISRIRRFAADAGAADKYTSMAKINERQRWRSNMKAAAAASRKGRESES